MNETYAALLAMWQAENARDKGVRDAMRAIAEDETRHAGLAWSVAAWLGPRLGPEARGRVEVALRAALTKLAHESRRPPNAALLVAGLVPDATAAERLLAALETTVRSASS